jgi:titin
VTFAATGACSNTNGAALITMTAGTGTCFITGGKAADQNYTAATSAPASVTATSASGPAAPTSLAAVANSSTQVTLTWADNANNEDGFRIERSTGMANKFAQIAVVSPNVVSFIDTGVSGSTKYFYRVRAFNSVGSSAYSNNASVTTPSGQLASPSGLKATSVSSTEIDLTWNNNGANATSIKIERSVNGTNFAQIAAVGGNATTFSDTGLSAATTYSYRVRASNASGDSAYSNVASAKTKVK